MTEEEQVAHAVQRSMAESGRDKAPVKEIEKEGGGPIEAHKRSDNIPSTHADQRRVLNMDPGAGGKEDTSEGTQEDQQSAGRVLPNKEAPRREPWPGT